MNMMEEILCPLARFRRNAGLAVPEFRVIPGDAVPEPYRGLLVHNGDMTSRLESYFKETIRLRLLNVETSPQAYRREVVLITSNTGMPVEYGAIEIHLEAFGEELRKLIVEGKLPLGGLLNRYAVQYRSQPKAFVELGADPVIGGYLGVADAPGFFGRSNLLMGGNEQILATIVEVLRPLGHWSRNLHNNE